MGGAEHGDEQVDFGADGVRAGIILLLALGLAGPALAQAVGETTLLAPALTVSDLDRSVKFQAVLGLVVGPKLQHGTLSEVILLTAVSHQPALILLKDMGPGKSPPLELGNGFSKVVMRVPDVAAVIARMTAAGYAAPALPVAGKGPRVIHVKDPDGYEYELVESPPARG